MCLQQVISKRIKKKIIFFVGFFKATDEKSRIRIRLKMSLARNTAFDTIYINLIDTIFYIAFSDKFS
jgi:hypothetical protein